MISSHRKKSSIAIDRRTALWIDIAIRILIGGYFAFTAGGYFITAFAMLKRTSGMQSATMQALDVFTILAIGFFAFFVACLYAIRIRSVSKFAGIVPAIAAVLGAFLTYGLLWLHPRQDLPAVAKIIADCFILGGNIFAMLALRDLGSSFSILPEGRELITSGPYRFIRHPIYLGEALSTLGAMINFLSPAAIALVAAQLLLQFARMHYEEKVLRETFPGYAKYSHRTARLIPGIY